MTKGFNRFMGLDADEWEASLGQEDFPVSPMAGPLTVGDVKTGIVAMLRLLDTMAEASSSDVVVYERSGLVAKVHGAIEDVVAPAVSTAVGYVYGYDHDHADAAVRCHEHGVSMLECFSKHYPHAFREDR